MATAADLPAADLAPYSTAQIRFAADAWPLRAAEELRSALIFRELGRASRAARMDASWTRSFAATAREEVGHARLCAEVGARLGAPAPRYDTGRVRARLASLPSLSIRLATLLVVEVAVGETISLSLFRAGRRSTVEPLSRAALTRIASDEARHQQLGWSLATELWPRLLAYDRAALQQETTRALAAFEQENAVPALRRLERKEPFDPAFAALGVLAPEARVDAFYEAIERHVVPRLDKLGLDGARAWSERYRAGSPSSAR